MKDYIQIRIKPDTHEMIKKIRDAEGLKSFDVLFKKKLCKKF